MMTIGSLFSGIGGLELGLEWAGVGETIWQCELSSGQGDLLGTETTYARAVLKRHWPGLVIFDDVRKMGADTPRVDVLCGGFPCQDISVGNQNGKGLDGERSGLFWEIIRIAQLIKPRFIVLENVANLINKGLRTVLWALAEIGYDAEWHTLSAADVGAPHLRKRVFIIAWRRLADPDGEQLADPDALRLKSERVANQHDKPGALRDQPNRRRATRPGRVSFPPGPSEVQLWGSVPVDTQPALCRVAHGLSSGVVYRKPILEALGNAVVPQCAQVIGRRLLEIYARFYHFV